MITPEQFKQSMKLVRLQIAVPISVLISVGANLVCALALKPGLGEWQYLGGFWIERGPNSNLPGLLCAHADSRSWTERVASYAAQSKFNHGWSLLGHPVPPPR
jgi:hypothetical protein